MTRAWRVFPMLALACALATAPAALAEEPEVPTDDPRLNMPTRTLGGKQFWTDVVLFQDWRIQRNVLTGHHRLLDGDNRRRAWGSLTACQERLREFRAVRGLTSMHGRAVIVLHGLFRSRGAMRQLAEFLETEGGYATFEMGYPSTRADIGAHAAALASVIEHLEGIDEINFVAHSLGGLVVRHYLADQTDPATGKLPDGRIKRIVMLAPPNHGSPLAEYWLDDPLYRAVVGPGGDQLARGPDLMADRLATPTCEFGILAGGRGEAKGFNPWIEGDNDGTVQVASTRLIGARDFAVLPVTHSAINDDRTAWEYTLRFLREGHFISEEARQPIAE
jgi:pimeloyl-ACP methyl ester carboxylesterase